MKQDILIFNKLIEKYKLVEPIDQDDQSFILKSRKKALKQILIKQGTYGLVVWLTLLTKFIFRDFGVKLTLLQSKIILSIATIALATSTSIGVYQGVKYVYKNYLHKESPVIEEEVKELLEDQEQIKNQGVKVLYPKETAPVQKQPQSFEKKEGDREKENVDTTTQTPGKVEKKDEEKPIQIVPNL